MAEASLQYQLTELKPEDFIVIPSLNASITKDSVRVATGEVFTRINWYDTKLLVRSLDSGYFLPTSSQWGGKKEGARPYLEQNYPELEKKFISGVYNWVDSLLAFPNERKEYSLRLKISSIKKGKVPLLIEQSKVERSGDSYILSEGKVKEVPELPLKSGYIQEWDDKLGLPTKVGQNPNERFEGAYFWVDTNYSYHEGLRALIRGPWGWGGRAGRFGTDASWDPSVSDFVCRLSSG